MVVEVEMAELCLTWNPTTRSLLPRHQAPFLRERQGPTTPLQSILYRPQCRTVIHTRAIRTRTLLQTMDILTRFSMGLVASLDARCPLSRAEIGKTALSQ